MRGNTITMRMQDRKLTAVAGDLYQYDYGQRLILEGVQLPVAYEVHFANSAHGKSKTAIGDATGVDIPDEFLLSGGNVYVWLFLHAGEDDGETEYRGMIPVIGRAKPTDTEPTPVQQDVITQAIAALNAAVAQTEADVEKYPVVIGGMWCVWDEEAQEFVSTDVPATGPKGDKGDKGDTGSQAPVDDTAGAGDRDKVWSANKLVYELDLKANAADPVLTGSISLGRTPGTTVGSGSSAIGMANEATGEQSHAEGRWTKAYGNMAHAEGRSTTASGNQSHAEGYETTASNTNAHAEGRGTTADGGNSHAEGEYCQALKNASHAEGGSTVSNKKYSHAEGSGTRTDGQQSHAEGLGTKATHASQHVGGEYNAPDPSSADDEHRGNYAEIIGNGTADNARSNARALDWDGNERLAGNLYVGCSGDSTGGSKAVSETALAAQIATVAETKTYLGIS